MPLYKEAHCKNQAKYESFSFGNYKHLQRHKVTNYNAQLNNRAAWLC